VTEISLAPETELGSVPAADARLIGAEESFTRGSRAARSAGTTSRLRAVVSIVVGFVLWEIVARFVIHNDAFLAAPSAVATRGLIMLRDGQLLYNTWVSTEELVIGFVFGAVAGILIVRPWRRGAG